MDDQDNHSLFTGRWADPHSTATKILAVNQLTLRITPVEVVPSISQLSMYNPKYSLSFGNVHQNFSQFEVLHELTESPGLMSLQS